MKKHFFLEISEGGGGESNGCMLKRSKTGHVYFQLKDTILGEGGVILHKHIFTFTEIWVRWAMQMDHLMFWGEVL